MSKENMTMNTNPIIQNPILQQLKRNGQMLDSEIAVATGISMKQVHTALADMTARGEIMRCSVTRYEDGKPIQAMQCRISGHVPPASPGRKPG